jgi:iron complex outermembrane receptor protein
MNDFCPLILFIHSTSTLMKKIFLVSFCFFLMLSVFSQARKRSLLSGKITDSNTGLPLDGASIILSPSRLGTSTDTSGNYSLQNIPTGHTIIEISRLGYKSIVEHLDLTGNDVHNFALNLSIVENEGVTVTGVGSAISIRRAPIPVSKISKAALLSTPSTNIIDALTRQPGVSQLSTGPAISKPIIRGLGYNRLVVINDGVRQEGQQWGDEHGIEIDENSVSRVEIVKGPASLIYGSDAMAGVINIITTSPADNNTIKGSILSSYQTNNKQRSLFGSLGGNQNGFNWNAWGDYKAAADYQNKYDGKVFNSNFNEKNFGGYAGYNGAWGFSHIIFSNFNQKLGLVEGDRDSLGRFIKALPGGLETAATGSDFNSITPAVPYQHVRHMKLIADNSFKVGSGRISLNLGWQENKRQEFGDADNPGAYNLFFDLTTFNYTTGYHFNDHHGWTTSIGLNGMDQRNQNKGPEVLIPEYHLFDVGAFVYSQKTINKATLSGGVRYDNRSLHSDAFYEGADQKFQEFSKSFNNFSGSAGVSYIVTDNFLFKLNIAKGFRSPSIPELASNGSHEGTNRYEYGDQQLKSETSWQGDAGIELSSDHVYFTANAFYNHIDNFIFYSKLAGSNGSDSLVNVSGDLIPAFKFAQHTANLYGAEMMLDIHPHPLDWLHWENAFSYVRARFADPIEGSSNVPFVPATKWRTELRAELVRNGKFFKDLLLSAEADNTFKQNSPFTAFGTETATNGYTLFNAGISANITNGNKTLCTLYFLANNITDVAYQNHLSRLKYTAVNEATGRQGVFNTGRNFVLKVNIPFTFETGRGAAGK